MEVDALSSSHPVSTPVENPAQIQEMFDDVSYDKVLQKPTQLQNHTPLEQGLYHDRLLRKMDYLH